jgi:hypothetical protein
MEWLAYASDPRLITDTDNTLGKQNLPRFREHRHDQSIRSLLFGPALIMVALFAVTLPIVMCIFLVIILCIVIWRD